MDIAGMTVAIATSSDRMRSTFSPAKRFSEATHWAQALPINVPIDDDSSKSTIPDSLRDVGQSGRSETGSLGSIESHVPDPRIAVKLTKMTLFLDAREVVALIAKGNYVSVLTISDSRLVRESISAVAEKLKCIGFVRIHRSIIVNRSHVQEIRSSTGGEYTVRVTGGREFAVTHKYQKNLRDLVALWMGTDHGSTNGLKPGMTT